MALSDKIFDRLMLPWLRRSEMENRFLRSEFARRYGIEIGLYSYGCFDRWRVPPSTRVGRYCSFAKTSQILSANHPIGKLSTHPYFYDPKAGLIDEPMVDTRALCVEDDVWIGHGAIVTPRVGLLGRGSIVGSGAVVTKDVPRYAIVAGMPARVIRYRFSEAVRRALDESEWWLLDRRALKSFLKRNPLLDEASGLVLDDGLAGPPVDADTSSCRPFHEVERRHATAR